IRIADAVNGDQRRIRLGAAGAAGARTGRALGPVHADGAGLYLCAAEPGQSPRPVGADVRSADAPAARPVPARAAAGRWLRPVADRLPSGGPDPVAGAGLGAAVAGPQQAGGGAATRADTRRLPGSAPRSALATACAAGRRPVRS